MRDPSYLRAENLAEACNALARPGAMPLAGGTDLVPSLRDAVVAADLLVDLRALQGLDAIDWRADGSVLVGAGASLSALAGDERMRGEWRALAEACDVVGSPQLRNMGTLGGNLCQRPRCWYFRQNLPCYKHAGTTCFAYDGENEYHAILGGGPCYIVHPSDAAVALLALDAVIHVAGPGGSRAVPVGEFFVLPAHRLDSETVLQQGEVVTAVELPAHSAGARQRYDKLMQRGAWDFAVVSLAAVRRRDGVVRLALGGVAPIPWRVASSVEEDVASGAISQDDIDTLAERALYDARPLAKNGYKVDVAGALLRRGMAFLVGDA